MIESFMLLNVLNGSERASRGRVAEIVVLCGVRRMRME